MKMFWYSLNKSSSKNKLTKANCRCNSGNSVLSPMCMNLPPQVLRDAYHIIIHSLGVASLTWCYSLLKPLRSSRCLQVKPWRHFKCSFLHVIVTIRVVNHIICLFYNPCTSDIGSGDISQYVLKNACVQQTLGVGTDSTPIPHHCLCCQQW